VSNILFGHPIYSDVGVTYTPTLSGGSWETTLPLTNVQDRRLARVARSTDALAASTTFDVDLGVARDVRVLAVLLPNITPSDVPTIRWRGSSVSNFASTVYDSGTNDLWPSGLTAEQADGLNVWIPTLPSAAQTARYWRCEITDTANADGYVDVARVVIAGGFQPAVNLSYGATLGFETRTERLETDGGATLYRERPVRRVLTGVLEDMAEADAFGAWFRLQQREGTSGQLFVVFDPADTTYLHQRAFLATFGDLDPLANPYLSRWRNSFRLVEEL
jgi:hypothetical protein